MCGLCTDSINCLLLVMRFRLSVSMEVMSGAVSCAAGSNDMVAAPDIVLVAAAGSGALPVVINWLVRWRVYDRGLRVPPDKLDRHAG